MSLGMNAGPKSGNGKIGSVACGSVPKAAVKMKRPLPQGQIQISQIQSEHSAMDGAKKSQKRTHDSHDVASDATNAEFIQKTEILQKRIDRAKIVKGAITAIQERQIAQKELMKKEQQMSCA